MAIKELSTKLLIVGRGNKCEGGKSAVEQSSYISRTTLKSEYYGETYYPKYSEDLVHTEIMLPKNAPEAFQNRETLWNSLENAEKKTAKAQIARTYKVELPNEWSYELATEVMRDYIKRNFVDEGMCAEWAIHDSENPQHQRNLHCHVLLSMRQILEDGTWGDKQKKIYFYDKDGNKIRDKNGKAKRTTKDIMGWNSKENATKWRKNLADTFNEVNQQMGTTENFWEYRSFAERGLDKLPTIHLGAKASAMERAGIATDRGNINREIISHNLLIEQAKAVYEEATSRVDKLKTAITVMNEIRNEVLELIAKIVGKKGRLDLPIVSGKYIGKFSDRSKLQSEQCATAFIVNRNINSFEALEQYSKEKEKEYDKVAEERQSDMTELQGLLERQELYEDYQPYKEIHSQSMALKGFAKRNFEKQHTVELQDYKLTKENLHRRLDEGEKITPKAWKKRIDELEKKLAVSKPEYGKVVTELAYAEVIDYNKKNYEREQTNERIRPTNTRTKEQEI